MLSIFVAAGMVARDYMWDISGRRTALSKYRIRDNYLRFYLRYLDCQKEKIEQGLFRNVHLENLIYWDTIMGYQFENLILNNLDAIHKTKRHDACQIDLLIHTKSSLYVCEIKFRKRIETAVADEVLRKIGKLPGRSRYSI